MPTLNLTTTINAPINICFDLSRSIDLHQVTTAHTNEKAIAGVTSGLIGLGEEVTWRAKHLGVYQKLSSKITGFEYPFYFQDTMVKGAFKKMVHDHLFEDKGEFTVMKDVMYFESPLGPLGIIANTVFLKKYLINLLERRNEIIKKAAETGAWKNFLPGY